MGGTGSEQLQCNREGQGTTGGLALGLRKLMRGTPEGNSEGEAGILRVGGRWAMPAESYRPRGGRF